MTQDIADKHKNKVATAIRVLKGPTEQSILIQKKRRKRGKIDAITQFLPCPSCGASTVDGLVKCNGGAKCAIEEKNKYAKLN